jgi:predicted  nucleic acid-binding Zn-ribbon protein
MPSPALEALLILQDRDTKRLGLEAQLRNLPAEVQAVERTIAEEKAAIEAARTEQRDLETQKKGLETEIGLAAERVGKYRTQQLSVRKNDEYQALGHEIETQQKQIGELEGKELEIMYAIDEAKKKFEAAETLSKRNISGHEARIRGLHEREASLSEELKALQAELTAARTLVSPAALRAYDRLAPRSMPAVVPIRGGKCGGCHLKISSEADSASRGKGPDGDLATCDQCGRIIYFES